jgi:dTDP-glucose 4,6-dehydratase
VNPVGPRGVYDEAKRFAEALTMAYHRAHGVETRIARIFNTYGPRMRPHDGRVVSNFCIQALRGEPLTIYGDGSQTRSFCFVTDTVEGLFRLLLSAEGEPVNIGNPVEFTIRDLVATLERVLGRPLPVSRHPLPQDDPRVRQPDITRARAALAWEPTVELETGLRATLAYFQQRGVPPPA